MRMKSVLPVLAAGIAAVSCGDKSGSKILVLYYSQTENTRTVATEIATRLGADVEEIIAVDPYDGTYQETIERSLQERESGKLPEVQPLKSDLSDYDVIFLGYPVWYGTYAVPVAAFLEKVDLNGKKVVPFCTFGSGGIVSSSKDLAAKFPEAEILPGYGVRAARIAKAPAEIENFLKAGGFLKGEYVKLDDFPEAHPVAEEEAAIFEAAVGDYPMIHAKAVAVASRNIPGGVEYLFTAEDLPLEDAPADWKPNEFKVYVNALEGQAPEFTQVVR